MTPVHQVLDRITLIAGLPGSGKTTLARFLSDDETLVLDDFHSLESLPEILCRRLIITDVHFCLPSVRQSAAVELAKRYPGIAHKWMFFENDAEKCRLNLRLRGDAQSVEPTIDGFAKRYVVPRAYRAMPIWQPKAWPDIR